MTHRILCPAPLVNAPEDLDLTLYVGYANCSIPCPTIVFSREEWDQTLSVVHVLCFVSVAACLVTFVGHLVDWKAHFIRTMLIGGFLASSSILVLFLFSNIDNAVVCDSNAHYVTSSPLCIMQAGSLLFCFMWVVLWSEICVYDTYYSVLSMETIDPKQKLQQYMQYLGIVIIVSALVTIIPLTQNNLGFDPSANIPICFFRFSENSDYFWFLFYAPICVFLVYCVAMSIAIMLKIQQIYINSSTYDLVHSMQQQMTATTPLFVTTVAPAPGPVLTTVGRPTNSNTVSLPRRMISEDDRLNSHDEIEWSSMRITSSAGPSSPWWSFSSALPSAQPSLYSASLLPQASETSAFIHSRPSERSTPSDQRFTPEIYLESNSSRTNQAPAAYWWWSWMYWRANRPNNTIPDGSALSATAETLLATWTTHGRTIIFVLLFSLTTLYVAPVLLYLYYFEFGNMNRSVESYVECLVVAAATCKSWPMTQVAMDECAAKMCGEHPTTRPSRALLISVLIWMGALGIIPSVIFGFGRSYKENIDEEDYE